jgi:hypothetical protein
MMIMTGSYHYTSNGINVAEETWSIETASDGTRTIKSVRDASNFGAYLSVHAVIVPSGTADYQLTFQTQKGTPILKSVRYHVETGSVYRRFEDGKQVLVQAPQDALFFPLMRVFTGQIIAAMIGRREPTTWIVPKLDMTDNLVNLFEPDLSERFIEQDPNEPNIFWLSGGPYVSPARLKLREDGMLENYAFTPEGSDENWVCQLVSPDA